MRAWLLSNSTTKLAILGALLVAFAGVSSGLNPVALFALLVMAPLALLWLWMSRSAPMTPGEGLYGLDCNAGCWALQMALPALGMALIATRVRLTGPPPYGWALLTGVLMMGIVMEVGRSRPRAIAPAVAVFAVSVIYACGTLVGLDAILDHRFLRLTPLTVTGMDATLNRRGSTYSLTLAGPSGPLDYAAPPALYGRLKVGDVVCLADRPGALGIAWSDLIACSHGE